MASLRWPLSKRLMYYRGQLLDEADFQAEQDYHRNARLLHNLQFHSWGVVQGLVVSRQSDTQVAVAPGLALDSFGREIVLDEKEVIDISEFGPNRTVYITFSSEEKAEEVRKSELGEGPSRMTEYSVLSASTVTPGAGGSVTLASVLLNEHAKIAEGAISDKHTQYASSVLRPRAVGFRELADGSVTQAKLADGSVTQAKLGVDLRTGWVRMAFKPVPWDGKEQFRLGPTEARSTEKGAGGSMGVPVPPGVTDVTRLRIAGELNEGTIRLALYRCGWDEEEHDHEKTPLFGEKDGIKEIVGETPARSFEHTMKIDDLNKRRLHAEYHALSVVIEATKKASISLIAVEFGYSSS